MRRQHDRVSVLILGLLAVVCIVLAAQAGTPKSAVYESAMRDAIYSIDAGDCGEARETLQNVLDLYE